MIGSEWSKALRKFSLVSHCEDVLYKGDDGRPNEWRHNRSQTGNRCLGECILYKSMVLGKIYSRASADNGDQGAAGRLD